MGNLTRWGSVDLNVESNFCTVKNEWDLYQEKCATEDYSHRPRHVHCNPVDHSTHLEYFVAVLRKRESTNRLRVASNYVIRSVVVQSFVSRISSVTLKTLKTLKTLGTWGLRGRGDR